MSDQIGEQTRRGISWSLIGAVVPNVTRVIVLAVLGRTLTSADFGIVAAAVSVCVIVYGLRDIGIGAALVQRKDITPGHIAASFAASTYFGLVLATLLFVGAPVVARIYHAPEATDLIRVLALIFFALRGLAVTSKMLAQRAMNFRLIAIVDSVSFVAGSITSIAGALAGWGPWSLIAGYFVEELIATAMMRWSSPPVVAFRIDWPRFRELLNFGVGQTLTQTANIVATYGDNLVVGNVLGTTSLGYYSRAYDLVKMPSMVFDAIVGNVLFAAFARLQDDRAALATNFRRVALVNALVLLPGSALLIVLAPETIRVLMGPGWGAMVLPFRILVLAILPRTNVKLGGLLAQAAGAVHAVSIAYLIYMVVVVGGALLTVRWGTAGVAMSTAVGILTVSTHCCWLGMRVSGLPLRSFIAAQIPGTLLASVVFALAMVSATVLRAADAPVAVVVVAIGLGSVLVCAVAVVLLVRTGRGDFAWLAEEAKRFRRRK